VLESTPPLRLILHWTRVHLGLEADSAYTGDSVSRRGGASSYAPLAAPLDRLGLSAFHLALEGVLSAAARNTKVWSNVMAQVCDICGKGPQFGNNISHAHNITRRRWSVNLQAVKALINGNAKRIRVCTSCIKSGKVAKA